MPPQPQEKPCPKCGSMMSYRLGEFECASCGHFEPVAKPQEEERSTGPGFRKEQWGGGASSSSTSRGGGSNYSLPGQYQGAPAAPPPPPPGSTFYGQQNIYGSPYEADSPPSTGTLEMEKKIYFGIQAASYGLIIIIMLIGAAIVTSGPGSGLSGGDSGMFVGMIVGGIIGSIIGLFIQWHVLFGDQIWLKWSCAGCTALSLLVLLIGFFIPASSVMEGQYNIGSGILQIGLYGWYLSILWRDIQRLQNTG